MKFPKYLIIAYFTILIVIGTYMNPHDVFNMWPIALFVCLLGSLLFLFKKYPDFFINKVTLFPVKIMIYVLSYTLIIGSGLFLIFMTSRLLGFTIDALKIALLKCFWIIK